MSINTPQPPPEPSTHPAVWDLVIADMQERDRIGTAKYGHRLAAHNGRDALVDAYQEVLDLAVYLRQAIYERDNAAQSVQIRKPIGFRSFACACGFFPHDKHSFCAFCGKRIQWIEGGK